MKLIYNTIIPIEELNVYTDIRIESDSYVLEPTESLLTDFLKLVEFSTTKRIDYNDLRKYAIVRILPLWNDPLIVTEANMYSMIGYYIVPNDFVWDSSQQQVYDVLVKNATACRKQRVDTSRSYVSLFYIATPNNSMQFYIDTELLINQFVEGKIPALEAFINSSDIDGFDYTTNGFSTKSYYDITLKNQLNYLLFR
jgi:hypothetical protein